MRLGYLLSALTALVGLVCFALGAHIFRWEIIVYSAVSFAYALRLAVVDDE